MKLKVTDDFKKVAKGILIYVITAIVVFPVFHLIKVDFCWEDELFYACIQLVVAIVVGAFYFFGSQIPEKNDN